MSLSGKLRAHPWSNASHCQVQVDWKQAPEMDSLFVHLLTVRAIPNRMGDDH